MSKQYLLSIDNGTQSIRAIIFDKNGLELAKSTIPITPYFSTQAGWAEQDPIYFWESVCKATNTLWSQTKNPKIRYQSSFSDYPASHHCYVG